MSKAKVTARHHRAFCRRHNGLFEVFLSRKDTKVWVRGLNAPHAWRNAAKKCKIA